jgi:hypothetical protein
MKMRKRRSRLEIPFEPLPCIEEDGSPFDLPDTALNPEQLCDQKQRCKGIDARSTGSILFREEQYSSGFRNTNP